MKDDYGYYTATLLHRNLGGGVTVSFLHIVSAGVCVCASRERQHVLEDTEKSTLQFFCRLQVWGKSLLLITFILRYSPLSSRLAALLTWLILKWLAFFLFFFLQHIFEYPLKRCTYSTVWLLHGWCHIGMFCVCHTTMHHVTSLHAKPHG